jgi:thiamine-monophosphate kinase
LSLDLARLCEASGCGAEIDLQKVPIADAAAKLAAKGPGGRSPLEHALSDGEDFELILAVPPDSATDLLRRQPLDVPLTAIGQFVEKRGVYSRGASGSYEPLVPCGYEHRLDQ